MLKLNELIELQTRMLLEKLEKKSEEKSPNEHHGGLLKDIWESVMGKKREMGRPRLEYFPKIKKDYY